MVESIHTSIGPLPPEWKVIQFRETCLEFFGGGTPSTREPEFWDGNIAWATSAHLEGLYLRSGQRRITEAGLRNSTSRVVPAGNLLVGTRVGVGKASVNLIDIAISQDLTGGIINKERFVPEYVALYLQTNRCQSVFAVQKRGATIKGIPREDLYRIEIAAPPLAEQRAIARVLAKIQAAVEVQEKIVATLKELKAAIMAKLFREGLRGEPLKQTEIGEIPESWEVVPLREIAELITKGSSPNWQGFEYCERGVLFIRSQNVGLGALLLSEVAYVPEDFNRKERRSVLSQGDLLINIVGASIGRVAVADERLRDANVNQAVALVRFPSHSQNPSFFAHFLLTRAGLYQMRRQKKEIARANLSLEDVGSFVVPVPARTEQDEIAKILESISSLMNTAQTKRDTLKSFFASMLHLLMTGQVRLSPRMIALQNLALRRKPKPSGKAPDQKLLDEIVRRIVEAVAPEKIILFGSGARGEMGPDSDIDLLVVKACDRPLDEEALIRRNLIGIGVPKDVVVVTPQHLDKHKDTIGYIYRPALREGKVLYAA